MASVFRQELGLTTVQEKQLSALESLNTSLTGNTSVTKDIYSRLDKIPDVILQSAGLIIQALNPVSSGYSTTASILRDSVGTLSSIEDTLEDSFDDIQDAQERLQEELEEQGEEDKKKYKDIHGIFENLKDVLKNYAKASWDLAVSNANGWSKLYNDTIKYIGVSGSGAQEFRRDIVTQVDSLNSDVSRLGDLGAKLNPQEALNTMISVAQDSNISNVETLQELTTPLLLAQQTTNLSLDSLAKLGTRMYTRYGFSSSAMEDMLDHIRSNTEGQNVDENALLDTLTHFETSMGVMYNGDTSLIESAQKTLLDAESYLQALGVSNTSELTDILYKLSSSDVTERGKVASEYGIRDVKGLYETLTTGDYGAVLLAIASQMGGRSAELSGKYGASRELWEELQLMNDAIANGLQPTFDDFLDSQEKASTARDRFEDKYVSVEDQINNNLTGISSYLATIQEKVGVGFSDITLGLSVLGNVIPLLGGATRSIAGGKGLAGLLVSPQGLAIGAVLAVVGTTIKGISDLYKKVNEDKLQSWGDMSKGISQQGTDYYWQSSMGSDGEVQWSMKGVDTSNFSEKELSDFHALQEKNSAEYSDYLKSGANLSPWEKFWNNQLGGLGTSNQSRYKDLQEQIGSYLKNPAYQDMLNYYLGSGLLDTTSNRTLSGFLNNIDAYKELFYTDNKVATVLKSGKPGNTADLKGAYDVEGSYAKGTNYVDHDQVAYIHEGEAITPAKYNPAANLNELERLRESQIDEEDILAIKGILSDIKEFIAYWKTDSDKKDTLNKARSSSSSAFYSRYGINPLGSGAR